tara:strand:- start:5 stop:211 length:207 start_codon:yes stop_codon:yes gene_type:complete
MQVRLEDLKTGSLYRMKGATFIVVQREEIAALNFPIYHLYFVQHRGGLHHEAETYTPSTLTALLKKWS